MALSVMELTGQLVRRVITRGKRDVEVMMLVAEEQEIVVRCDKDSPVSNGDLDALMNKRVKALGVLDGSIMLLHEIASLE